MPHLGLSFLATTVHHSRQAEELSKGVVAAVLSDPTTASKAASLLVDICARPDVRQAAVSFVKDVSHLYLSTHFLMIASAIHCFRHYKLYVYFNCKISADAAVQDSLFQLGHGLVSRLLGDPVVVAQLQALLWR